MKLLTAFTALLVLLAFARPASADRLEELEEKVRTLEGLHEESAAELSERGAQVSSFFRDSLRLGGFFDSSFTGIVGPDTKPQATSSSNIIGLNISATYSPRIRFTSQLIAGLANGLSNQHNDARATVLGLSQRREFGTFAFGAILAQGYMEYDTTPDSHLQGGLGYAPFGSALQLREPVLFIRRGGPQLGRTTDFVSPLWSGLHFHGELSGGASRWGYNVYTFTPTFYPRVPALGTRLWKSFVDGKVLAGFSNQFGRRGSKTFGVLGTDVKLNLRPIVVTAEFAQLADVGPDVWSAYVEPAFTLPGEEWIVFSFADFADSPKNKTGAGRTALSDPYRKWEYGAGANWLPTSFTRVRLTFSNHDYVGSTASSTGQNRDYVSADASVGVAF